MHGGVGQGVVPGRRGVVEVGAGVLGEVQAAPPQVEVQLVGVPGAGGEARSAQDKPRSLAGCASACGEVRGLEAAGRGKRGRLPSSAYQAPSRPRARRQR